MKRQSIIKGWLVRTMIIILIVLIGVLVISTFSIKNQYYSNVRQIMESSLSAFSDKFMSEDYAKVSDKTYFSDIRYEIESFSSRDKMELMGIDPEGNVLLTSSGFPYQNVFNESDFIAAGQSANGLSEPSFLKLGGEEVMAISLWLPREATSEPTVLRLVVSLEEINRQIIYILGLITLVILAFIILIAYSNSYFISSLVIPVQEVSEAASKIARGKFTERLEIKSNDEIGELSESINNMADELAQAELVKNEFISSVSHELRTPLTAIRGWAETLSYPSDDEAMRLRGMDVILGETERLATMVEELLDFSKMQSGKFSLALEPTDLLTELEEAELMFYQRANREGVTLSSDLPEFLSFVMGDKNRLRQVFINILDNAFKYTDSGGSITIKATEAENNMINVYIIDTGKGISQEDLKQVKTRFYKGKDARRGSGIGLSVVEEIVSRHGGKIDIESEQGKGTTVTISLPTLEEWEKRNKKGENNGEREI